MRLSLLPLISTSSPDLTRLTLIKVDSIISDIAEAFGTSELWSSLQYLRLESFQGWSLLQVNCKLLILQQEWLFGNGRRST